MKKMFSIFPIILFTFSLFFSCSNSLSCDSEATKEKLTKLITAQVRRQMTNDPVRFPLFGKMIDSIADLKYPKKTLSDSSNYWKQHYSDMDSLQKIREMEWTSEFMINRDEYKMKLMDSIPKITPVNVTIDNFQTYSVENPSDKVCFCSAKKFVVGEDSVSSIYYSVDLNEDGSVHIDFRSKLPPSAVLIK